MITYCLCTDARIELFPRLFELKIVTLLTLNSIWSLTRTTTQSAPTIFVVCTVTDLWNPVFSYIYSHRSKCRSSVHSTVVLDDLQRLTAALTQLSWTILSPAIQYLYRQFAIFSVILISIKCIVVGTINR